MNLKVLTQNCDALLLIYIVNSLCCSFYTWHSAAEEALGVELEHNPLLEHLNHVRHIVQINLIIKLQTELRYSV